ncbi:hypothetical protein H6P81_021088 [Aristolochia fimbriata]|uniref:Uncharacterized protein n=1 Tax=Aristolochia fimbriata TaxID=158543 RepID=A0AAV7DX59_ARIFI|nr:hypothetical protein H6P81_021088 [Aristolochia fimbriata]
MSTHRFYEATVWDAIEATVLILDGYMHAENRKNFLGPLPKTPSRSLSRFFPSSYFLIYRQRARGNTRWRFDQMGPGKRDADPRGRHVLEESATVVENERAAAEMRE